MFPLFFSFLFFSFLFFSFLFLFFSFLVHISGFCFGEFLIRALLLAISHSLSCRPVLFYSVGQLACLCVCVCVCDNHMGFYSYAER